MLLPGSAGRVLSVLGVVGGAGGVSVSSLGVWLLIAGVG